MKPTSNLKPGIRVKKKYVIEKIIGQGGMGKTYLARVEDLKEKVVLKVVILSEMKEWKTLELFEREAKTLKNLDHPHIPKYIDDFHIETKTEVYYFLVMEYIEGKNFYELVSNGKRFSDSEIIVIFASILKTLDYIHSLNPAVIHRDIQPKI